MNNYMTKLISDNPLALIGLGIVGLGLIFNEGNLQSLSQTSAMVRSQREASQRESLQAQIAEQKATDRYNRGCVFVVAQTEPGTFTSLSEGQPVIDQARQTPLSNGVVVCDREGGTGVISNGVVSDFAFTGNRTVIDAALAKAQIQAASRIPAQ